LTLGMTGPRNKNRTRVRAANWMDYEDILQVKSVTIRYLS